MSDSHQNAQQENNMLADGLEVSAEAQEALVPRILKTRGVRRAHPRMSTYHGTAPSFRFGPRRAKDALMATSGAFQKTRRFVEMEIKHGRTACLFVPRRSRDPRMAAGLYYSTTTGNTETVAGYIAEATGLEATDIGDASGDDIAACDSLIIGAPTWHTGADTERSGTAWDEFLYGDLTSLDLTGKKVAIFGMGDQSGYADNYCDAMDELATCFEKQGATIVGMWPTDGYDHEDSKSLRGDKFIGCAFDEDNQPEMSEERAQGWVAQLKGEGISL